MRTPEWFVKRTASSLKKKKAFNLVLILSITILTSLTALVVSAQNAPSRGAKVGNSYAVGDFETVNTTNGNLMLNFPLGSLPGGRGEVGAGISLIYNSKLYDTRIDKIRDWRYPCTAGPESCRYFEKTVIEQSNKGGWKYSYGTYDLEFEDRRTSYGQNPPACVDQGAMIGGWEEMTYVHKLRVVFPDGSTHEMIPYGHTAMLFDRFFRVRMDGTQENCGGSTTSGPRPVYYSIDGTYLRLESSGSGWTLYFGDGRKVTANTGQPQRISDRNGNYVDTTGAQATDQFGRSVTVGSNAAGDDEIRMKGYGAEDLVWTVKWKIIGVFKSYQACLGGDGACPADAQRGRLAEGMSVIDKITMPQQMGSRSYTFSYNAPPNTPPFPATTYGWGEVSGVTLPTGAQISYTYAMDGQDGGSDPWSVKEILRNYPNSKTLAYNQDYDGTSTPTTETWSYGTSPSGGGVISPDGSSTTNSFGSTDADSWDSGLTFKTVSSDGTMKENLWAYNCPVACTQAPGSGINPYVKTEFTSIKDASGNYALTAIKDYTYDKNGNVTQTKDYDWMPYASIPRDQYGQTPGIPSGVAPKRTTTTGYYAETPEASVITTDSDLYFWTASPKLKSAAAWSEVRNGSNQAVSRAEMFYDSASTTGNLIETKVWDSFKNGVSQPYSNPLTAANSISMNAQYNSYGSPILTTDAKGNQTQVTYGAINTPTGTVSDLYPTQIVSAYGTPIQQTVQSEYDFSTGLVKKTTALGNTTSENVSTEMVYDAAGRPLISKAATGTANEIWTQMTYDDLNRRVISKSDLYAKGDAKKVSTQFYDQLGRVRLTKTLEDSVTQSATNETDGIKVQTRYSTGNPYSYQLSSNPYRAATPGAATNEPSMGWTRSKSINTGKHSEVETFSGAALPAPWGSNTSSSGVVSTDADADRTLVTDQAGKRRISQSNALGQLTNVWEVKGADSDTEAVSFGNPALSLDALKTSYQYDTLNNLTTVNQGVQTRTFSYSSLSRLKSANNPESRLISYQYDNNGNLTKKTDARQVVTDYIYDELNRVKNRNYSVTGTVPNNYQATQNVAYIYDGAGVPFSKGRLTEVDNGISKTKYTSFDVMGRVTGSQQITPGVTIDPQTYIYNLSGALVEEKYPSGRVVKNVLDSNGDLELVQSKKNQASGFWNYAKSFTYTAAGAASSMQLGNGKWESTSFNSRLQPTQIALGTVQNGIDNLKLNFTYSSTPTGTDNNGNVLTQTVTVPTETRNGTSYTAFTATQSYSYDSLNRLKTAQETIPNQTGWKQTFKYDRYGNRNFDTTNAGDTTTIDPNCAVAVCNPTVDPATNKLVGYQFDSAGNTKVDANGQSFTYDGENKQVKVMNGSTTIGEYSYDGDGKRVKKYVPSTGETTIFVYDADGKIVAEYSTIVESPADAKVSYLTNDRLGSPRISTDANGQVISRHDYLPFGEEIDSSIMAIRNINLNYGDDGIKNKFTGYRKDDETDLDFAEARMYVKTLGRFNSVDPLMASAKPSNPQTFNRYAYVLNNPLKFVDPWGLKPVYVSKTEGETTTYYYVDDKSDQYKDLKHSGFTIFKPSNGQTITSTEDRTIEFTNSGSGFRDLGPAGNATAQIYFWDSSPGSSGFKVDAGHLAIKITLGNSSIYISFYPGKVLGRPGEAIFGPYDSTGHLHSEKQDENNGKPEIISVDKLDWSAISQYYAALQKNPGQWDFGRDCADIVAEVLTASGLSLQNTQSSNSTVPGTANLIKEAAVRPRNYGQGVTWRSNWTWGIPTVK